MKPSTKTRGRHQGFALVITLSLMILLTILAVGLLSLSSVSLRSSAQGAAMASARANARLALMMALSDLQKSLGPDKAITATSGILAAAPGKPNITGVWSSWDFDPTQPANYTTEKQNRFQRWLVSSPDPAAVESQNFGTSNWAGTTIELVGTGSLGASAPDTAKVRAGRVPISCNGKVQGAYAWQVADESVKARINLYRDPAQNTTLAKKRALLAGQRPDPAVMKGADGNLLDCLPTDLTTTEFTDAKATVDKVLDLSQVELLGAAKGKIKQFRNDITPYSLGVLTDVRRGGLKQDLSSVFEMTTSATSTPFLPAEFTGKHLYESTHGITGASDPYWSLLASYYNVFRGLLTPESNPTYSQRPVQDAVAVPTTYFAGPVITKIETLFSFVTRDAHLGWMDNLTAVDPNMKYMGHLVYTPQVTLHNPYNVSISFDSMEVVFRNLPVAFQFFVNNKPQSIGLVPLCEMFVGGKGEKSFALNIANQTTPASPIVMKPGQTLVCSSCLDPSTKFGDGNTSAASFFDYTNSLTGVTGSGTIAAIPAKPGFYGRCMGFDIDWLTPPLLADAALSTDKVDGVIGLRLDDTIHIEYAVRQPSVAPNTSFEVTARISSQGRIKNYGGLNFYYKDGPTLQNLLPNTFRYPQVGEMPAGDAYIENTLALGLYAKEKTIAVFSAYARTTHGGVYDNTTRTASPGAALRDGRLAGKPYQFHNPASPLVAMDLSKTKPSGYPYELNFQPFTDLGQVEDYFALDLTNRTPSITGNTTNSGIKSGSYLEVPSGPLQTIADFRRSNVLASSYQPSFVQPVANSWVHPMMSTDKVSQPDETGNYNLLDHSVLANHALYDRFYFSTFATNGTLTPDKVFYNFMTGAAGTALLSQCFQPYLPFGKTNDTAKTELFAGGTKPAVTAYQNAAQYQMVRGAFNVNSTSVQAWKAVLASARKSDIATLWEKTAALEVPPVKATNTAVLPMSLVNGGLATAATVDANKVDDTKINQWNGYRELDDADLETLAQKIVDQVRARGPFLSMSEFVNRQIGADGPLTESGALESALAAANTNTNADPLKRVFKDEINITAGDLSDTTLYNFKTPNASCGNPAAGAPGWITQGDLMRILEPAATVRSDTFVIRVYGEALDPAGKVSARAYAEAVVQRVPEYVDPVDSPAVNVYTATGASQMNKTFGRRINVVSFRWLTTNEI
jgi:hypothetical protein